MSTRGKYSVDAIAEIEYELHMKENFINVTVF